MARLQQGLFHIVVTDTFGGEASFCWKKEWIVKASSELGAIRKLAKREGGGWTKDWGDGSAARYNLKGACVCAFVSFITEQEIKDQWLDNVEMF